MPQVVTYFVSGHTAKGYVNYLSSNVQGIQKVFVLKHPSNRLKTSILKLFIDIYKNDKLEILASSTSEQYIEGLIIRNVSVAILTDQVVPQKMDTYRIIDLESFFPVSDQVKIVKALSQITQLYESAYTYLRSGLQIHEKLEEVFINEMDFEAADQLAEQWIHRLFKTKTTRDNKGHKGHLYERLFGTNTSDGIINVIEQLIDPIENRIFIKGRAGSGKSFFMRKIKEVCLAFNYDVEVYRCSFDPESIDMLIIRELNYCFFDSTAPHEFFPTRENDIVLDLYGETITPGTDEQYEDEIGTLTSAYRRELSTALSQLKQIQIIDKEKEALFTPFTEKKLTVIIKELARSNI